MHGTDHSEASRLEQVKGVPKMRHLTTTVVTVLFVLVALSAVVPRASAAETPTVHVIPVEGPIDKALLYVMRRAFRETRAAAPDAVILELETPGGGLRETEEIINWIRALDLPVYAFVNRRAQSAGAIISLGTDAIFMAPGSRIGSAMPIMVSPTGGAQPLPPALKEKVLSDVRAMVRGLAQENGHWEELAEAMVDPAKELKVGDRIVCPSGKLLNLTAEEAIEIIPPRDSPLLSEAIVPNIQALLEHEDLSGAEIRRFKEQPAEQLARYITLIGPILLALGLLGIYIEIKTPGFGIPGILGAVFLGIFFFGHYVAGLAGIEDIFLVVLGVALLAIEVFVIPGFGIAGILGLLSIVAGIVMAAIPHLPDTVPLPNTDPLTWQNYVDDGLQTLFLTIFITGAGVWLLSRILPKTPIYQRIVLQKSLATGSGHTPYEMEASRNRVGQIGTALTPLRPSGTVRIGDDRVDVVTSGDLIDRGTQVRVIEVEGNRVVVERVAYST